MSDSFDDRIVQLLEQRIAAGDGMSAASIRIERRDDVLLEWLGGRMDFDSEAAPVTPDSVFRIASVTKPMSCCGVAKLIERGQIDLDYAVAEYVPEFAQNGKEEVLVRHCFTHSSGLPDMLPENEELRIANAPLPAFVEGVCRTPLLFPPGTDVRYQSMGILMLAEIVQRVTGVVFSDYMSAEVFGPAGMASTHLGWRSDFEGRLVTMNIDWPNRTDGSAAGWDHNSVYWRDIAVPWGGVHSSAADVARLLRVMLNHGESLDGVQVMQPGTARMMLADHTGALPGLSRRGRLSEGYGLGWRLQRRGESGWFGAAVPEGTFGHAGGTGTVAWADPASGVSFVLLTNGGLSTELRAIHACGNIAAAALC